MRIIGMHGRAGAGKDKTAEILAESHLFTSVAFADKLKEQSADAYGVTVDFLNYRPTKEAPLLELAPRFCRDPKFLTLLRNIYGDAFSLDMPMSPRRLTQLWGTEYRRAEDPLYWVKQLARDVSQIDPGIPVAIRDVREEHEVDYIQEQGGLVFIVHREGLPAVEGHSSENGIRWRPHMMHNIQNAPVREYDPRWRAQQEAEDLAFLRANVLGLMDRLNWPATAIKKAAADVVATV